MKKAMLFVFVVSLFLAGWASSEAALVLRYNGPRNSADYARALAVDGQGNVYVTGASVGSGTDEEDEDYATIKYGPTGQRLWVKRYNGPGNSADCAQALAVDGQGNVYVTGRSAGSGTGYDYATIKYGPTGQRLWVRRYNGPGNDWDEAQALAVDSQGNVYVTGESVGSAGSGTDYDYATIKYGPTGQRLWVERYNGPGNNWDEAQALAVDGQGNVYVTGRSVGSGTDYDYATIKYGPTGQQLWVARYNGPGNSADYAHALAVDSQRNVYVTGESTGSGTSTDYATIKYGPTGQQLWVARYNGPGNSADYARALAVDGQGNVYVTGGSVGSDTDFDYATIKYGPTGQQLWVRRYNGAGNDWDEAHALAVDGQGNVYVTGTSDAYETSYDYATIKYGPTGQRLWVQRYNGPGNGSDWANALAVDGQGNVYVTGASLGSVGSGTDFDYATIIYGKD